MTTTPTSIPDDNLGESWVEIGGAKELPQPLIAVEEAYLRLLKEAQRESSNHSSTRDSTTSSHRNSPKSPPNSPNLGGTSVDEDFIQDAYINENDKKEWADFQGTDWIWEWSSRPDQLPPKDWKFRHPKKKVGGLLSIRTAKVGNVGLFSREIMYTIIVTNLLSLLLGTGVGVWLSSKKGAVIVFPNSPLP